MDDDVKAVLQEMTICLESLFFTNVLLKHFAREAALRALDEFTKQGLDRPLVQTVHDRFQPLRDGIEQGFSRQELLRRLAAALAPLASEQIM